MARDQFLADVEAEPEAYVITFNGVGLLEEPFKNPFGISATNPAPGIGHRDTEKVRILIPYVTEYAHRSIFRGKFDRVIDQISKNLADAVRVGIGGRKIFRNVSR